MDDATCETINSPEWLLNPGVNKLLQAFEKEGIEGRFVGGCVRDSLLGREVSDLDIAVNARPDIVLSIASKYDFKAIPTGLQHGTVTLIVDSTVFEITTLRRDVETDGRHAVIAFTDDWLEDASRRDFTMNAMYLDGGGNLYDPFDGLKDALEGRIRFVGKALDRLEEDALRLLRYYRFRAHYGYGEPDAEAAEACLKSVPLLQKLSKERVREEVLKLLKAPDPVPCWREMIDIGAVKTLLPELVNVDRLGIMVALSKDPFLRLASLLAGGRPEAGKVAQDLRLSNAQAARLRGMSEIPEIPRIGTFSADITAKQGQYALYHLGKERVRDLFYVLAANQGLKPQEFNLPEWGENDPPVFPLAGRDVLSLGVEAGAQVGQVLDIVRTWWADQDFVPDRAACLGHLERVIEPVKK